MSGLKDVVKGGWHPGAKDGKKESWRGDFKGINQVAGWMGKNKDSGSSSRSSSAVPTHRSAPISTLKDPSTFGPPPRRGTADVSAATSPPATYGQRQDVANGTHPEAASSDPFRIDKTGLNIAHLPKPPVRRGGQQTSPSPPAVSSPGLSKPKPSLPPRLPPRQSTTSPVEVETPATSYQRPVNEPVARDGYLNQGALNRLGQAGVSVPGFNIGSNRSLTTPETPKLSQTASPRQPSTVDELQSRLAKLGRASSSSSASPSDAPQEGTTWAQKQAAFKTASKFRNDPSSVSLAEVKGAASTANNFRERHGQQVAAGMQAANGLNQKYGLAEHARAYGASEASTQPSMATSATPGAPVDATPAAKKKPPPPPPPKRKDLGADTNSAPPVPLSSRPAPP